MNTLIVGGSSGLGLAMAKYFAESGDDVLVTGRTDPQAGYAQFQKLDLSEGDLSDEVGAFVKDLAKIDRLVYAAGLYQDGRVTDLSPQQIEAMVRVSGTGLIYFMRELLAKQGSLGELVTITSTSQWTPRKMEPIYNFTKAGVGHFSNSMASDGRVGKVLVVGPDSMDDEPWNEDDEDILQEKLPKEWVAKQITDSMPGDYKYKFIRVLREPARVEEVETR